MLLVLTVSAQLISSWPANQLVQEPSKAELQEVQAACMYDAPSKFRQQPAMGGL